MIVAGLSCSPRGCEANCCSASTIICRFSSHNSIAVLLFLSISALICFLQSNSANAQETLAQSIDRRIAAIPPLPEYLYSADTISGSISTVWMNVAGRALSSKELRERYDEFYFAALGYRRMAVRTIFRAKRTLAQGNSKATSELIASFDRNIKLFNLSVDGATAAYEGNSSAAVTLAKGVYDGSSAALKFGVSFLGLGPVSSLLVDVATDGFDFLANMPEIGLAENKAIILRKVLIDIVFDVIPIGELGNKTLSDFLSNSTTKIIGSSGLYRFLDSALHSPQFEKELIKALADAGKSVTVDEAKALVDKMVAELGGGSKPSAAGTAPATTAAIVRTQPGDFFDQDTLTDFARSVGATSADLAIIEKSGEGNVLTFHPDHAAPWFVEETITISDPATSWVFSIRGHPSGDYLARAFIQETNGAPKKIYEKIIVGKDGWYKESIDLKNYAGKTVKLRLEGNATGWYFEHGGLDYFYVLKRSALAESTAPTPIAVEGCKEPVVKEGMSGQDAQAALGSALDKDRSDAIYYLVKGGKLRVPQCGPELGLALTGATESYRAKAIEALAPIVKANLSGEDAAAILGTAKECSESNRANAIYHLAVAKKFKPILSGKEMEMILDGTTGSARAKAIEYISTAGE